MNDRSRLKRKIMNRMHGKLVKQALHDANKALKISENVISDARIAIRDAYITVTEIQFDKN